MLTQLLADDAARESRQVGVIDMKGRAAAHTGKQNGNWAGSKQGRNYTVQANIMVGPEVVDAVAATFESTEGTGLPFAERMILALEAGYAKGGDRRWGNLQSAAIKIADPNDPGRGGDYIALAIEVGEHADPVGEMKRIYYTTGRRLGYRSFSQVDGADVIELKRMLHALGYWRPSLAAFPDPPPPTNTPQMQDLRRANPAQYDKLIAESRRASAAYSRDYGQYDAETIAAVDKFRADKQSQLPGQSGGAGRRAVRRRAAGRLSRKKRERAEKMTTYIGLLRAINLAGRNRVGMADLRDMLSALGFDEPRSLLQSGNVLFRCRPRAAAPLERLLEAELRTRLKVETDFMVRTAEEWHAIVERNPFPKEAVRDPGHLLMFSLKDAPDAASVKALQAAIKGPEIVRADGREAYISYPARGRPLQADEHDHREKARHARNPPQLEHRAEAPRAYSP